MTELLDAALDYAVRGWAVVPCWWPLPDGSCACGDKACDNVGKHPLGKLAKHGYKDATHDPAAIRRWWEAYPQANIGIATGARSGFWVLDADGEKSLEAFVENQGMPLPRCPQQITGGGRHLLFAHNGEPIRNRASDIAPGLDTRADGGLIIAAPSRHYSGRIYEWDQENDLDEVPLPTAPDWLVRLASGKNRRQRESTFAVGTEWIDVPDDAVLPPGCEIRINMTTRRKEARRPSGSNGSSNDAYGRKALEKEVAAVRSAPEGTRNDTLNKATFSLGQLVERGHLDQAEVERELKAAALDAGLEPDEIDKTIASGLAAGLRHPRVVPPRARVAAEQVPWPEAMAEAAFHGLAGEVVRALNPLTEADPVAILLTFLAAFGNAVGRGPHVPIEGDRHGPQLYAVLVGESSKARKGTSWSRVRQLMEAADPEWAKNCTVRGGLSSGEGVIWEIRDPITKRVKDKQTGDFDEEIVDPGVEDKRLMIAEGEFATALRQVERPGNTLSAILRMFWDTGDVRSLTKNSPARTTGAQLSTIGHITLDELRRYLTRTEMGNGFANRFIFACVRRSKELPFGGPGFDPIALADQIAERLSRARLKERMLWTDAARAIWGKVYGDLSEGKPGMLGAVTARAEAQCIRLAVTYALLDGSSYLEAVHIEAALAIWRYSEASARFIFWTDLGDEDADIILRALTDTPAGLTRTEISALFGRNKEAGEINRALSTLARHGLAEGSWEQTGGRPIERWRRLIS
jgi:hypothetical protein